MKRILYMVPCKTIIINEAGEEEIRDDLTPANIPWSAENEERAKRESYNGEYTIKDDGQPEPEPAQTDAERITELEEALDLLLSGAVE